MVSIFNKIGQQGGIIIGSYFAQPFLKVDFYWNWRKIIYRRIICIIYS
jgi:hypothetical protein